MSHPQDDPLDWDEAREIELLNRMSGLMMFLDLLLPNRAESVGFARTAIRLMARTWNLPSDAADAVELLTSELFTNATKYGLAPGADPEKQPARLFVYRKGERLRVEVHDSTSTRPFFRRTLPSDESGRGYLLVAALSADTGSYVTATGKAVWFELTVWR